MQQQQPLKGTDGQEGARPGQHPGAGPGARPEPAESAGQVFLRREKFGKAGAGLNWIGNLGIPALPVPSQIWDKNEEFLGKFRPRGRPLRAGGRQGREAGKFPFSLDFSRCSRLRSGAADPGNDS